jgi:small nuclear ribonucleoprotein (snRNP)-like protein
MLCFFAGSVMADQVTLKNGDRLTGTIVKSDAKTLLIKTEFAGEVNVQWDAVSAMVSSQTLHLALKDGQTIVGTVTAADNKFDVATKETGPVTASKDAVAAVRNDAEQKAYDQQVERLRHPHLLDFWSGMLDTGLSLTRGNSDSLTYSLASKAVRATERDKITVYSDAIYTKSTVNGVSSTSAHSIRGGVRGDLNVREKWFVFGFTDFEYDAFQHLDLRNVLGGGLGYHVVKTEKTTFDLFGGGDFE